MFRRAKARSDGLQTYCSTCQDANQIQHKYGLSHETYLLMLQKQNGVCAICGQPPGQRALSVDHNHETGKVRGLLCASCNQGVGNFRDSIVLLRKAETYLAISGDQ